MSVVLCAVLVAASLWLTPERLDVGALAWMGACPARLAGTPCLVCGMSHSFAAMAALDWQSAARFNAGGPYLFLLVFLNTLMGLGFAVIWLLRGREARRSWAFWP